MKRILFVDDDPNVLSGLRRMLFEREGDWQMEFLTNSQEALSRMEVENFDVLVTDMRMPELSGEDLLLQVHEQHPETVRVVLSGYSEAEAAMRAVPVTHQFMSKPCNPLALEAVVERACALQMLLKDDKLRKIIGQVDSLPSAPTVFRELTRLLANDNSTAMDVAKVVEKDPGISAKLLQVANNAFFGRGRRTSDIVSAVRQLGMGTTKNLVMSIEVFRSAGKVKKLKGYSLEHEHAHSLKVGMLASRFLRGTASDDGFMAGMLHDVGKLVMAAHLPEKLTEVWDLTQTEGMDENKAEQEVLGTTHAEIGAYLLGIWGLPYAIVEAVAYHHRPDAAVADSFSPVGAVHAANRLFKCWEQNEDAKQECLGEIQAFAQAQGQGDAFDDWLTQAERILGTD